MKAGFHLEVVEYISDTQEAKRLGGRYKHVGYMNKVFKTRKAAINYYDKHNPHLRSINAHDDFQSDWDPETKLMYIVRDFYGIASTIDPW